MSHCWTYKIRKEKNPSYMLIAYNKKEMGKFIKIKPNGCEPYICIDVFPVLINWLPLWFDKSMKLFNFFYYSCSLQLDYWHDSSSFVVSIFHLFALFNSFLSLLFEGKSWESFHWKTYNRAGVDRITLKRYIKHIKRMGIWLYISCSTYARIHRVIL